MSTLVAAGHVLIGANVNPALAGMAKLHASMNSTAARAGAAGAKLTKGLTAPIAVGFGFAIKAAADFESSLNDMKAVSGATDAQMKAVSKTAKQLGADTQLPGTSAKDAADAMVQLAKGGMTAKQAMDAARGTLLLSAAAGVDNARAAEIQADALNAFGLSANHANRVADILAASANSSTAEIDDMAMSLAQSATIANQAGWTIEDTATALSMLANAGIKGSDAGTSLKTMLMRLQAPMGAGAKAIEKYGINLRDSSGAMLKQAGLAKEFQRRLGGLSKAERDRAMAAIFGTDAIRAGNILLGASTNAIDRQREASTEAGAAQTVAAAKMKGFNGALEGFKSAIETAAITVGAILLPVVTDMVRWFTGLVEKFESLPPGAQKATVVLLAVAAAVGPLLLLMKALAVAVAVIASPIGLVVAALVALGAGLIYAYQNSETFRNIVNGAFEAVRAVVIAVVGAVGAKVAEMVAFFRRHWAEISATVTAAMNHIRTAIQIGVAIAKALWSTFGPVIVAQTRAVWNVVRTVIETAMRVIGNIIRAVMAVIRGDWGTAWSAIKAAATAAVQGAAATIRAILTGLASVAAALARAIGKAIINGIKAGLAAIRSIYSLMWTGISGAISSAAGAALSAAAAIGRAIISGVLSGLSGLASAIKNKVQSALSSALSGIDIPGFSPVDHAAKQAIALPIIKGAVDGLAPLGAKMKSKLTSAVRESIMAARDSAASLSSGLAGMIGQGIDALTGTRVSALGNSPEAQRLREIERQQRQEATFRERARLDAAIANAGTDAERAAAVQDLNDWILDQERQALADSLAQKEQAIRDEADAKKTAAERGLADLTDQLNRGLISQQQYTASVNGILASYAPDYATTGALLGSAFAGAFQDQVTTLLAQTGLISGGPGVGLKIGPDLENPAAVASGEAYQNALKAWNNRRDTLVDKLQEARAGLEKVNDNAVKESSPGGKSITADERKTISTWSDRAAAAQAALAAHNKLKPVKAKLGGIVGGVGRTDSVHALLAPGEGVLHHRNMDRLMDMAMAGNGGGARTINLEVTIVDQTMAGMSRDQARRTADAIAPHLGRRIAISA